MERLLCPLRHYCVCIIWPEKATAKASNIFSPDFSEEQISEFSELVLLLKKRKGGQRREKKINKVVVGGLVVTLKICCNSQSWP